MSSCPYRCGEASRYLGELSLSWPTYTHVWEQRWYLLFYINQYKLPAVVTWSFHNFLLCFIFIEICKRNEYIEFVFLRTECYLQSGNIWTWKDNNIHTFILWDLEYILDSWIELNALIILTSVFFQLFINTTNSQVIYSTFYEYNVQLIKHSYVHVFM